MLTIFCQWIGSLSRWLMIKIHSKSRMPKLMWMAFFQCDKYLILHDWQSFFTVLDQPNQLIINPGSQELSQPFSHECRIFTSTLFRFNVFHLVFHFNGSSFSTIVHDVSSHPTVQADSASGHPLRLFFAGLFFARFARFARRWSGCAWSLETSAGQLWEIEENFRGSMGVPPK